MHIQSHNFRPKMGLLRPKKSLNDDSKNFEVVQCTPHLKPALGDVQKYPVILKADHVEAHIQ